MNYINSHMPPEIASITSMASFTFYLCASPVCLVTISCPVVKDGAHSNTSAVIKMSTELQTQYSSAIPYSLQQSQQENSESATINNPTLLHAAQCQ